MMTSKKVASFMFSLGILIAVGSLLAKEQMPEVVCRGQTEEEAFSFVMYLVKKLRWFNEQGYKISLPIHQDFEDLYRRPELLEGANEDFLKKIFYEEVYEASKFAPSLEVIGQTNATVQQALQKLAILERNWGFKIKPRYDIILTLYGPGGTYSLEEEVGLVIIRIDEGLVPKSKERSTQTIVHEMVHIGIQENIVRNYNLSHWEKERLVDLICSLYLSELLPNYVMQEKGDRKIDNFVNEKTIIDNLPMVIEAFVAQNPRVTV